ncbi:MAG TPA: tetratricopeptide repeat protein [Pirellulales bacterium]|nr:tetratricopeptide repeat protein [Pirellulales bacterium]
MLKETAKPKLGKRVLDVNAVRVPSKVTQVKDGWLWVGTAWVRPADVVPLAGAPAYFTALLKSGRNVVVAYVLRGISWFSLREYDNAIKDFSEAIKLEPGNSNFFTLRGNAYDQKHLYDAALADFTEAIRLDPTNLAAYNDRGCTLTNKGEYQQAEAQFNEVLRMAPDNALAYANRGTLWCFRDDLEKALADLNRSIEIDPKDNLAFVNRGRAYMKRGDYPEAMADYDQAIALDADDWYAYDGRARILATAPEFEFHLRDGKQAVEVATKACELSAWSEWRSIGRLAAAYAEAGDFEAAVKWQTKAIEMSQPAAQKEQGENEHRLQLYQAGKPFYEEVKGVEERKDGERSGL